jgi:hypothetical protein
MKKIFAILLIPMLLMATYAMGSAASLYFADTALHISPLAATACVFLLTSAPTLYGYIANKPPQLSGSLYGITVELWTNYIMDNLFKSNPHLINCYNDDQYVVGGSVVHIPQAGAKPTVVKNRSSYPGTAIRRTDTDATYALDVYTTDPTHIPKAETLEISYDKMDSVLSEHVSALSEVMGDALLYKWRASGAANILRTTGAGTAAHLASATGNRKVFLKEDLKRAQVRMNTLNIPKEDRFALMDSEMFSQLQDDSDLKKRDVGMELDMKNGVIMRLYGFNIMERSSGLIYDNTGTPVAKDYDAVAAAADNAAVLCWQKNAVARALGTVDFFENLKDALYYGDIYSALVKMGGRTRRTNAEGVVSIVQAASA